MIEWQDEGILLSARAHGERDVLTSLLTFEHGRHAGLVIAGTSRRLSPMLQPGNRLEVAWKARLEGHLGRFAVEPRRLFASLLLEDALRLAASGAACALVEAALPEREPHAAIYAALLTLMEHLAANPGWPESFVRFELLLLTELGYGLDLSVCAVTGGTEELVYVSPKTGKAVSREGAGEWADRLLPLPGFLIGAAPADDAQIGQGLRLAGHFLRRHIFEPADRALPIVRDRLVGLWHDRHGSTAP